MCFFELQEDIGQFMEKMGSPVKELKCPQWVQDLAFMVDITQHLNNRNKMLQGRKNMVTQYNDSIRAFKLKLSVWETQLSSGDTAHLPCLTAVHATRSKADMDQYKDKITGFLQKFERRSIVKPSDMPADIQLEIIHLQCDTNMKEKFSSVGFGTYYQYLLPGYPKLTSLAAKVLSMFGTTYLCEQVFSVMNLNKAKHRSRLTNTHLNDIGKFCCYSGLTPDIDAPVKAKRCKVSGARSSK